MIPEKQIYGVTAAGESVHSYTLRNELGSVTLLDFGCTIHSIRFAGRELVLHYPSLADYEAGDALMGALVGRVTNRIRGGQFTLGGTTYQLSKNDGENHNHGTFPKKRFSAACLEDEVVFSLVSPDGEEGYPGQVRLTVHARLEAPFRLTLQLQAETDKDTLLNLTNHAYFNLTGDFDQTVDGHYLRVNADAYTPADATLCPTGEIRSVQGEPIDLRTARRLAEVIAETGGLDHNFVLNSHEAAELYCPETGIRMAVFTTQPGLQAYSGNFLETDPVSSPFRLHAGVALEAQHFPNSPHCPNFPSILLRAGERFDQTTSYEFSVEDETP